MDDEENVRESHTSGMRPSDAAMASCAYRQDYPNLDFSRRRIHQKRIHLRNFSKNSLTSSSEFEGKDDEVEHESKVQRKSDVHEWVHRDVEVQTDKYEIPELMAS